MKQKRLMFPLTLFSLSLAAFFLSPAGSAHASSEEPFAFPSNNGGTGLMEVPTARVMKENSYRVGAGQVKPYRYFYGAMSPLKGLEVSGRVTEVLDVPSGVEGQKNYKDKAVDIKAVLLSERKYLPALAFGVMDPHGTRIYSSQYLVASKQIYPFDFTLGLGNGRFGKRALARDSEEDFQLEILTDTKGWIKDSQFFWGVQFAPSDKFALMVEYSPIEYHKQVRDPAYGNYFQEPVRSKYNFGVRYRPVKWFDIDVSYQRGDTIGVNASLAFDIGAPLVPIYDPPYMEAPSLVNEPLSVRIAEALRRQGFSDISVALRGSELTIEAQNDTYYHSARAIGSALAAVAAILPVTVGTVHFLLKENGIPQVRFSAARADLESLYAGELTLDEFYYLSEVRTDVSETLDVPGQFKKKLRYGIRPSLETFLNDPSGFFKYRFGVAGWAGYSPWAGATIGSAIEGYPLNNISTSNQQLSIPVRSDVAEYKEKKLILGRLLFDQIYKTGYELYGKLSAGLLEVQYAGLDGEIARPFFDGRIMLGLSGSAVKKRDPDNPFKLKEDSVKSVYTTAFLNTRLNIPEIDISFDIKAGRFLAGDEGVRFAVSKFIRGVTITAWYTMTDTSEFSDEYNRGYSDKGISVSIPLRLFLGYDSRSVYHYSLAPWTRDTGQDIYHFGTLFDFMERNTKKHIDRDREMLYR